MPEAVDKDTGEIVRVEARPDGLAVTAEQVELVRRTYAVGATEEELALYLYDCKRQGVHPMDRLLHFTKRKGRYVPVTSIDLMRKRAAESGEYAGSDDAVFAGGERPTAATVTVWRLVSGARCPFVATARWSEYCPDAGESGRGDIMWQKMPHTMLAKCAEALALRKGFPREVATLYAKEEMDQADNAPRADYPVAPARPRNLAEQQQQRADQADAGATALLSQEPEDSPADNASLDDAVALTLALAKGCGMDAEAVLRDMLKDPKAILDPLDLDGWRRLYNEIKARAIRREAPAPTPKAPAGGSPTCEVCGVPMKLRLAQKGKNAGHHFWGCPAKKADGSWCGGGRDATKAELAAAGFDK